jgi:hypothetical protein
MHERPNVVTMVAKAGLGEMHPKPIIPPSPTVYIVASFSVVLNLFGGTTSLTMAFGGGGAATASNFGGGAGGTTFPC